MTWTRLLRTRTAALTLLAVVALSAGTVYAEALARNAQETQRTVRQVAAMLPRFHLNHPRLDDAYSTELLDAFLKSVDPPKRYLTKKDVDDFRSYAKVLDDMLKQGNVDFAHRVMDRFKQRAAQWTAVAQELIDQEHYFTTDEEMVVDPDELDWTDEAGLRERWRKFIKFQLLQAKLDDKTMEEAREKLHKKYRNEALAVSQMTDTDALERFLTAASSVFDPHSSYMSPNTLEEFAIMMKLSLDGIGATLRSEDGYTTVVSIVDGGAADEDGRLEAGDVIIGVGQSADDIEDIVEVRLDQVVRKIRGPRGSKVYLQVRDPDGGSAEVLELTRKKIEIKDAEVRGEVIDAGERIGRPMKVGVVSIPSFYRDFDGFQKGRRDAKSAVEDVRKVLADFRDQGGVDALIVDVRNNGGGALTEAIDISGLFIDDGPVVQVRDTDSVRSHSDTNAGTAYSGPLVVATNRASASASEIFAGVIKDYRRGVVVGDTTTHGKGTVQNVMPVRTGMFGFGGAEQGALKLTIQQFYRVNGDSTQNRGVPSDIVLPSLGDHYDSGEAFLDNPLPFDQIAAAGNVRPSRNIDGSLIARLAERSRERVSKDEDFSKINKAIARYLEVKNRKTVSLNEAVRRAERAKSKEMDELDEVEDEETEDEAAKDAEKKEIFPESPYNDELLNVAADYVELLRRATAQR